MKKALALAFIVGLITSPKAMAELKVGDDAPNIFIKDWVKGEAFDLSKAKDKDVIVVEFWATWCPPCKASIPHMSEMQDHFKSKGVTFIGVTDEDKELVSKFLKNGWDEKMRYRVAVDNENKTSDAWMKASNQRGIPTAFVVQGGKLKWIGHPMDELGLTVAKLAGDEEYAKKEEEAKKEEALARRSANAPAPGAKPQKSRRAGQSGETPGEVTGEPSDEVTDASTAWTIPLGFMPRESNQPAVPCSFPPRKTCL